MSNAPRTLPRRAHEALGIIIEFHENGMSPVPLRRLRALDYSYAIEILVRDGFIKRATVDQRVYLYAQIDRSEYEKIILRQKANNPQSLATPKNRKLARKAADALYQGRRYEDMPSAAINAELIGTAYLPSRQQARTGGGVTDYVGAVI